MKATMIAVVLAVLVVGCNLDPGRAQAERAVRDLLLDPESARFEGVAKVPWTGAYCGRVYAKNSMGGYSPEGITFAVKDGVVLLVPTISEIEATLGGFLSEIKALEVEKQREAARLDGLDIRARRRIGDEFKAEAQAIIAKGDKLRAEYEQEMAIVKEWCKSAED